MTGLRIEGDVLEGVVIELQDLLVEDVVDVAGEVGSEMPGDQHAPFLVQYVYCRDPTHFKLL
jgi:hypothetical protein